jgi:DNA-binding NarL/FixJ family response regulator
MEGIINILVASGREEDRKQILQALSGHDDLRIAGVEKDEAGAIIKSWDLKPDVLSLDLQPSGTDEPELASIIHRKSPATAIIVICDKDENNYAGRAINAGISGFLLKETDMDKLIPIVKIVASEGYYISAAITKRVFGAIALINQFPGQASDHKADYPSLSPAERSIVIYIGQGLKDEEIAGYLNFSIGTIRNCLSAIKRKTRMKNRTQIVVFSLVYGLISIDHLNIIKDNNRHIFNDPIQ